MGISTHILDTALGRPAAGVPSHSCPHDRTAYGLSSTKPSPTPMAVANIYCLATQTLQPGTYRVHFETAAYYKQHQLEWTLSLC